MNIQGSRESRPAALALLACLLAGSGIGCRSVDHRQERDLADGAALGGKTDFRGTVGRDREVNVHLDLARAFEAQGNDEAAVGEYQRAVEVADGPAGHRDGRVGKAAKVLAHRRMANALDRLGQFAQAEVHYREALAIAPEDPRVWNDAGYSLYLQRRWADAERTLLQAARIAPDDPKVQTNLGLCLAAAGKPDEALAALSRAGGPAVAQANLGYILAAMGRTDEARAHYRAALALEPEFGPARFALDRLDSRPSAGPPPETAIAAAGLQVPNTVVAPEPLLLTGGSASAPIEPPAPLLPLPIVPPNPVREPAVTPVPEACPLPTPVSGPVQPLASRDEATLLRASLEAGIPLPNATIPLAPAAEVALGAGP